MTQSTYYMLSNKAHGYLQSAWLSIVPGQRYKLSVWLLGHMDEADMEGGFAVRAVFAKGATNNTSLGSQTAVASSEISTTW